MATPFALLLAPSLIAVAAGFLYRYIILPAFLSGFSYIPAGHWSAHISPLWLLWLRWAGRENQTVYKLHMKHGKAVRLAPRVLSLNCVEGGLKEVYLGGFPKTDFYVKSFANYGVHNIFTFEDNASHSARKRMVSNIFSNSSIAASPAVHAATREILFRRLFPILNDHATRREPLEVHEINYAYSMDSFMHWQFGRSLGSDLLRDKREIRVYLDAFFGVRPRFHSWFSKLGIHLASRPSCKAISIIEQWNLERCDKAQKLIAHGRQLTEDEPAIFAQAYKSLNGLRKEEIDPAPRDQTPPQPYPKRLELAADMFTFNAAALETSGNILTYAFFELSRNAEIQEMLRGELRGTFSPVPSADGENTELPSPKDVNGLPYLDAILMETLRRYPSIPGPQPRVVPSTCSLGGYDRIPEGTVVHCAAYSLHHTPWVFPDPEVWRPKRWLEASPEELRCMRRWFWAFGSGGRMCIGTHFAVSSMKYVIAAVYSTFRSRIHDHGDMEQSDGYLAGSRGQHLELMFERA